MTPTDESGLSAAFTLPWEDAVLSELWAVKRRINGDAGFDLVTLHAQAQSMAVAWRRERNEAVAGAAFDPALERPADPATR